MSISNQSAHQIDLEVDHTTVARMFDLRNVLELIDRAFDNRSPAQQNAVHQGHGQAVFEVRLSIIDIGRSKQVVTQVYPR